MLRLPFVVVLLFACRIGLLWLLTRLRAVTILGCLRMRLLGYFQVANNLTGAMLSRELAFWASCDCCCPLTSSASKAGGAPALRRGADFSQMLPEKLPVYACFCGSSLSVEPVSSWHTQGNVHKARPASRTPTHKFWPRHAKGWVTFQTSRCLLQLGLRETA